MTQLKILLHVEPHSSRECDCDLQPTTNKRYWRNLSIFPAFFVSLFCAPPTFLRSITTS